MIKYKVYLSEPAENDLLDIIHYISVQFSALATTMNMLNVFETAIAGLADMPQKCPLVADERLASMGYRKLIVKNYLVFFTIDEKAKQVNVERILFARREWSRIL